MLIQSRNLVSFYEKINIFQYSRIDGKNQPINQSPTLINSSKGRSRPKIDILVSLHCKSCWSKFVNNLPNVGSNINSLNCLVNLTLQWAKLHQTLGNNLPTNSSKRVELGKFYATLVKCYPIF